MTVVTKRPNKMVSEEAGERKRGVTEQGTYKELISDWLLLAGES